MEQIYKQMTIGNNQVDAKPHGHERWKIFIDGASRGNPGPSGAGVYILSGDTPIEQYGFFLHTKTNNQAEYLALTLALFCFHRVLSKHESTNTHVTITSDSELLIKQMKGIYKIKNPELISIKAVADLLRKGLFCHFEHVLRHLNTEADALANLGIDKKKPVPAEFKALLLSNGVRL